MVINHLRPSWDAPPSTPPSHVNQWLVKVNLRWVQNDSLVIEGCNMCHGQKSLFIGDGRPPTFNRNPYNGYINPYYWVDDHPLLYGNNGSLDPGTYDSWLDGLFTLSHPYRTQQIQVDLFLEDHIATHMIWFNNDYTIHDYLRLSICVCFLYLYVWNHV